jgi:hypothetical protein
MTRHLFLSYNKISTTAVYAWWEISNARNSNASFISLDLPWELFTLEVKASALSKPILKIFLENSSNSKHLIFTASPRWNML